MSDSNERDKTGNSGLSRRKFLKSSAGVTGGLLIGSQFGQFGSLAYGADDHPAMGNYPLKGDPVFGFVIDQTGAYADEGADQFRALKLAVKHINEGGGILETMKPLALKGNGILGKKVSYVVGDGQTNPDAARAVGRRMIERDGVITFTGGSSSSVAIAQQDLAQEKGVIFMCALTHSNDTTGKDRRRFGFRMFFDAYMTGKAIAPIIAKEYGKDRRAFHLTADYNWGHSQLDSMKRFTEEQGWTTVRNIMTPLSTTDYSQYLTAVLNSDADVLVLNHYGQDAVYSLTQAVRFGLKNRQANGKQMQIVVPLLSQLIAEGVGPDNMEGVYGTVEFNYKLDTPGAQAFTKAYMDEYDTAPGQAGHTAYTQMILYADAAERAGTHYPPEVIKALEGFEFDGAGYGPTLYRACDHQGYHRILAVRGKGKSEMESKFDVFQIVGQVEREDVMYPCDQFAGDLGPYKPSKAKA